jgi:hypothetical protein
MSTSQEQQEEIRTLLQQAREIIRSAPTDAAFAEAIRTARAATTMDPRFALSWYELGQLQMSARHFDNAEVSFRRARDEDVCPLRMTTPLENAMSDIGADDALLYLDAHALLRSKCRNGIVGENVLIDHVHPSFAGHQEIAIAIVDRLIDAEFVSDLDDHWKENARSAYKDHLQQLDDSYFLRGRRTLKNLQLWAAGRSGGPPLPAQKP